MTNEERHIAVLNRMLESMDVYDSIQPTTERKKAIKAAIKALEQQPCDDAINRDMALEKMADYAASGYADSAEDFEEYSRIICQLPSVTPQQKYGKWIVIDDCEQFIAKCSECGRLYDSRLISKYPYCHCGAKMFDPQESEDKTE